MVSPSESESSTEEMNGVPYPYRSFPVSRYLWKSTDKYLIEAHWMNTIYGEDTRKWDEGKWERKERKGKTNYSERVKTTSQQEPIHL